MSFEWWKYYEHTETQKTKVDLENISTGEVEKQNELMKKIRQSEKEDKENDLQELNFLEQQLDNWIDKEIRVKELQVNLYDKLWIDVDTENNPDITKFVKWVVDWLVVNNLEEIQSLINSSLDEVLELLNNLFNIEVLKELIKQTVEELWDIWNIMENPYNWWLVLGTLWLWWLGKLLRWLKVVKQKDINTNSELYEMKGREWKDFSNEWANYVWKEIWDFADSLNINELLKDTTKLNKAIISINKISVYIDNNVENVLKLDATKLSNFKDNISVLRKKIEYIYINWNLNWVTKDNLDKVHTKLKQSYKKLLINE